MHQLRLPAPGPGWPGTLPLVPAHDQTAGLFLAVEKRKAQLQCVSVNRGVITRHMLMRYCMAQLKRLK